MKKSPILEQEFCLFNNKFALSLRLGFASGEENAFTVAWQLFTELLHCTDAQCSASSVRAKPRRLDYWLAPRSRCCAQNFFLFVFAYLFATECFLHLPKCEVAIAKVQTKNTHETHGKSLFWKLHFPATSTRRAGSLAR